MEHVLAHRSQHRLFQRVEALCAHDYQARLGGGVNQRLGGVGADEVRLDRDTGVLGLRPGHDLPDGLLFVQERGRRR